MAMAGSSPYAMAMAASAARHGMKRLVIGPPSSFISAFCSSSAPSRKLLLYSKPGCCLCDGLKEKLNSAFSLRSAAASDSLSDVVLEQVRDITSNPEWENAYQYEIPVLAKLLPDGAEEVLPRLSPRLSVELVHKKIAAALK